MADPPICKRCDQAHWPFNACPRPEPTAPAVSAWPEEPPEGLHRPAGFGQPESMLDASLGELGFGGAPATIGYTRPRKRS
jgi:hypothetical protein